ncbi:MAG: nitrogenase component 1 [bacterium]
MNRSDTFVTPGTIPFLTGVYVAINAIEDAYLVVDGPNCVFFRIPQLQPNHDWLADLARSSGLHRVVDTDATPSRVAQGNPRLLLDRLREVDGLPDCGGILLTTMAHVAITGRQYPTLLESMNPPLGHPVILIPQGELTHDWLDGYGATLAALARELPLASPDARAAGEERPRVALVGHMLHRREADATADLAELIRLLEGLELEVVGTWLDGGTWESLGSVGHADWVLSLPYGREAARILAARAGAELLELPLPVGPGATVEWIRCVAEAVDRRAQAEAFIEAELRRIMPRLEWIVAHELLHRRVLVAGDPHLVDALTCGLSELGCAVVLEVVFAREGHPAGTSPPGARRLCSPSNQSLVEAMEELRRGEGAPDVCVVNSLAVHSLRGESSVLPFVEVGFPSYYTHALYPAPLLGFDGTLSLVTRLVNTIRAAGVI